MLARRLHPRSGDRPEFLLQIEFFPRRAAHLARSHGGQDGKAQRQTAEGFPLGELDNEGRQLRIGHGSKMTLILGLPRETLGDRTHRSLALAIAGSIGPIEYGADPLKDTPR